MSAPPVAPPPPESPPTLLTPTLRSPSRPVPRHPPRGSLPEVSHGGAPHDKPADRRPRLRSAEAPPDVVRGLIRLADDLTELIRHASAPESGQHPLRLVEHQVNRLLIGCGVVILRDEGPVVSTRHEVVDTRQAGANDTRDWIATTVRPGYLYGDQLIRPQQVVAYTAEGSVGTKGSVHSEG